MDWLIGLVSQNEMTNEFEYQIEGTFDPINYYYYNSFTADFCPAVPWMWLNRCIDSKPARIRIIIVKIISFPNFFELLFATWILNTVTNLCVVNSSVRRVRINSVAFRFGYHQVCVIGDLFFHWWVLSLIFVECIEYFCFRLSIVGCRF